MRTVDALSQEFIATARDAFISNDVETPGIRPETMASWRRSKAAGAAVSEPVSHRSDDYFDRDSALLRAARPVTDGLLRQFHAEDLAMLLIDRNATVVGRWSTDRTMEWQLDKMGSVAGAVFDEACVGSTGLGTPLEDGVPAVIDGTEHYNSAFDDVIAAGAPIINPATGVVEGVIDLVSPTGAPAGLMLPVVANAAREAGELLASGFARQDRALLDAFMQIERRGKRRPMLAVNNRLMMTNSSVEQLMIGVPHREVWNIVQEAIAQGQQTMLLERGSERGPLEVNIRVVEDGSDCLGAVLQLKTAERPQSVQHSSPRARCVADEVRSVLAGTSLHWTDAVRRVSDGVSAGRTVVLTGPDGSGKTALATNVAARWAVDPCLVAIFDASTQTPEEVGELPNELVALVIDNIGSAVRVWYDALRRHAASGCRVLLVSEDALADECLDDVDVDVVELPGLAHRVGDIAECIRHWAAKQQRRTTVAPGAVRRLERRQWSRNVDELLEVLDEALASSTTGQLTENDFQPGSTEPRRQLTYLENVEREAISGLLKAAAGKRSEVAKELGISRATLYRKLATLGLNS